MSVNRLTHLSLFTSFIIVLTLAFPQIPVPILNINVTLQTFIVMLVGLLLSPTDAFISMLLYLLIGALGFPVFTNFHSGIQTIVGPTGGFLIAFPIAAYLISLFNQGKKSVIKSILLSFIFGSLFVNIVGGLTLAYSPLSPFYNVYDYPKVLLYLCIFLPTDFLKALLASFIYKKLFPIFHK